jgi:hypothetical protein
MGAATIKTKKGEIKSPSRRLEPVFYAKPVHKRLVKVERLVLAW